MHCKPVRWLQAESDLRRIRRQVFIEEQGVEVAEEWDGRDVDAQHFLIYHHATAVGCARVLREPSDYWHIGRVAVLAEFRGSGVGLQLMQSVLEWCRQANSEARIYLHAQTTVTGFYEKFGFCCRGNIFMDAGIPHVTMWLESNL